MLEVPKQLANKTLADLANEAIDHTPHALKWWGLTLFGIEELNTFDRLFDAEVLTAVDCPGIPFRLRCVFVYEPFLTRLVALSKSIEFEPEQENVFIANLAKSFAIASIAIAPS